MAQDKPIDPVKVLFVCMGNICRSPSAEAVFHNMVENNGLKPYVEVASAGTHSYHVGDPADRRSHQAALDRGVDMSRHRAQHLKKEHFDYYDYILVMDDANYSHTMRICPPHLQEKVHYFMDFAPQLKVKEVPDLVEAASAGLMSDIRTRYVDPPKFHPEINA